jgi:lysozyme family protein
MADFNPAFVKTILGNEGGYNPGIGEKETYRGIDRGANPNWSGWKLIDGLKAAIKTSDMNELLSQNILLQASIKAFYKVNYWDAVNLDNVKDQQLANNLFDCSVNQGTGTACRIMQMACNYVIAAVKVAIKPLVVDGIVGSATIGVFNGLPAAQLNAEINAEREASYRRDSGYAEWGKVWDERLLNYVT